MKTVLFIDRGKEDLWSSFLKYDFLLDEFKREGLFSVCEWNPEGMSVAQAIPDLPAVLGECQEWQAIVVCDLREKGRSLKGDVHFDNPFDFSESYDSSPADGLRESPSALVRLTQMLGGFPEKMLIEWPDTDDGPFDLGGYELAYATSGCEYGMIERYRLGLPAPIRVVCVTPREVDPVLFDLCERELRELEVSDCYDFWQRNDYPPSTRFIVCDRPSPALVSSDSGCSHVLRHSFSGGCMKPARNSWFYFWMSVLTLATSTVIPSDLPAFKVFNLRIEIDDEKLTDVFARRRAQWLGACHAIDAKLRQDDARLSAKDEVMGEVPDTNIYIPVSFDQVKHGNLHTDPSEVKFVKDKPVSDRGVWFSQKARIFEEFRELLRAPRRSLHIAAKKFRATKPLSSEELEYSVLNDYQIEKLEDELRSLEIGLAEDVGRPPFQYVDHQEAFEECARKIEDAIDARPTLTHIAIVAAFAALSLLIGFLPAIVNFSADTIVNVKALMAFAVGVAILSIAGFITLWFMRRRVRKAYKRHDEVMAQVTSDLASEAKRLEMKISSCASFKKKWSLLDRQLHLGLPTRKALELGYRRALLKTRIRDIDEIASDCEIAMVEYMTDFDSDWTEVERFLADASFYSLCDVVSCDRAKRTGVSRKTFEDVPYVFIKRASLELQKVH